MVTANDLATAPAEIWGGSVEAANDEAFRRLNDADPWVVDVRPAREVLPGYRDNLVLTSGAPMPWEAYVGGQREALIGGALFEGLAADRDEAIARFADGSIEIGACHDYNAVGGHTGIETAAGAGLVVETLTHRDLGVCKD